LAGQKSFFELSRDRGRLYVGGVPDEAKVRLQDRLFTGCESLRRGI
jgi:hypothetical protein